MPVDRNYLFGVMAVRLAPTTPSVGTFSDDCIIQKLLVYYTPPSRLLLPAEEAGEVKRKLLIRELSTHFVWNRLFQQGRKISMVKRTLYHSYQPHLPILSLYFF